MKQAQGMSINVIVVMAIALIVLIVLVIILTGRFGTFGKGLSTCNGFCSISASTCDTRGAVAIPMKNCNSQDSAAQDIEGEGFCCIATS